MANERSEGEYQDGSKEEQEEEEEGENVPTNHFLNCELKDKHLHQ
jgi:hypothetical protein